MRVRVRVRVRACVCVCACVHACVCVMFSPIPPFIPPLQALQYMVTFFGIAGGALLANILQAHNDNIVTSKIK